MKKIGMILMAIAIVGMVSCKGEKKAGEESCCSGKAATEAAHKCGAEGGECCKKAQGIKVIVARVAIKKGQEKAFIDVATKLVEATHAEEGNIFYSLYQSATNPSEFVFYEQYKDDAAFQVHGSSAHFAAFAEGIKDLTDGDLIVEEFYGDK
jgi:quinol monooxygenase YgiN